VPSQPLRYLFGDYCFETQRYELHRSSVPIPLRPKVYQVLAYLLRHYDRVVLKQELLEHVWPGQAVGDAALNSYIKDIRKTLAMTGMANGSCAPSAGTAIALWHQ
jgi:DNA-binding winged helix-turn-helix (wHTH) protein